MKKLLYVCCFLFLQQIYGQYTQVPDPNFEQALIDLGIDSEETLDGQFLTADGQGVLSLFVNNKNINDLTGIEAFVDLLQLNAYGNNLTNIDLSVLPVSVFDLFLGNNNLISIDLSPLPNLLNLSLIRNDFTTVTIPSLNNLFAIYLGACSQLSEVTINYCPNLQNIGIQETLVENIDLINTPILRNFFSNESQIQSLDFTNNPNLEEVRASNSPLSSINLPNNPNLEILDVDACQLTELDITNCPNLIDLECYGNMLTTIDFSNNILLEDVNCGNNQLTSLDLSNNSNIWRFWASNNQILGDLDFSGVTMLEEISLINNLIKTIDLSQNNILLQAYALDNPNLEMVNIKNGNNENMFGLTVFNCPSLSCIVVDDPLADNDFILIEAGANITLVSSPEECNLSISKNELQNLIQVYPNPVKDILFIENNENIVIEKIIVYDILGKIVLIEKNYFNQLNLSDFKSGILFIKIETDNNAITKKVVKN